MCPGARRCAPDEVLQCARRTGVAVNTLADFDGAHAEAGLAIGYGSIQLERIEPGLRRLAEAFSRSKDGHADLRS